MILIVGPDSATLLRYQKVLEIHLGESVVITQAVPINWAGEIRHVNDALFELGYILLHDAPPALAAGAKHALLSTAPTTL